MSLHYSIKNNVTGDVLTILESPSTENNYTLVIKVDLPPHAKGAPLHVHMNTNESFVVEKGELTMQIGKMVTQVFPNQKKEIPAGLAHSFRNTSQAETTFISTINPGSEFKRFLLGMYGLANDGKTNAEGMPKNPFHLFLLLEYADLNFGSRKSIIQKNLFRTLAGLSRFLNYEKQLTKYWL